MHIMKDCPRTENVDNFNDFFIYKFGFTMNMSMGNIIFIVEYTLHNFLQEKYLTLFIIVICFQGFLIIVYNNSYYKRKNPNLAGKNQPSTENDIDWKPHQFQDERW